MTKIAVDCDEVLMDSIGGFTQYMKELYGFEWLYHDYKYYRLEENDHIDFNREEIMNMFNAYLDSDYAKKTPPITGAFEKLKELYDRGHELYVITARGESQRDITTYQIDHNFPGLFKEIFIVGDPQGNHTSKSDVCKNIGATILIEDSIDNCLDAAQQGIASFLLERPRNKRREDTHPLLHKIQDWQEIVVD